MDTPSPERVNVAEDPEKNPESRLKKVRMWQNLHVGLWLLKDASWCQAWVNVGLVAAVPALALAAKIAWDSRRNIGELIHSIAVCLWLSANVIWMIGEFFFEDAIDDPMQDPMRHIARYFFFAGMLLLGGFYVTRAAQAWIRRARS